MAKPEENPPEKPKEKPENSSVDRRDFLKIAATGAAALVSSVPAASAQQAPAQSQEEHEGDVDVLTAERTGSDFMVDVLKSLGFEYICSNPGASFRALQESFVNHGGNKNPEWLTCLHEESSVAMAHGYAKIEGKPLLVLAHGTVGLQHATLPIYLGFSDAQPIYVIVGNHLDAMDRRPGVDWGHSVQDVASIVRDFTKWDDMPVSLGHFADSAVRAYKISLTPPRGPVLLVADGGLQEHPIPVDANLRIPKLTTATAPEGDSGAIAEAARLLVGAENPAIVVGRVGRSEAGYKNVIELAELLQAAILSRSFPSRHPLNQSGRGGAIIGSADVILGLEVDNFYGSVNSMRDQLHRTTRRNAKADAKLISISTAELFTKSNYQNFQRYQEVDLSIAADAGATLRPLIEAVKRLITPDRKSVLQARGAKLAAAHQQILERTRTEASYAWDASPISTPRLAAEVWAQIKNKDWSFVVGELSGWPPRLWDIKKPWHMVTGATIATGSGLSVGAALANRKYGRLTVHFQDDGDLMYAPGVLWTAAHHKIPMLKIMNNNRAYHQEIMHLQRMANRKNHDLTTAGIGNAIDNPNIDFTKLAQSMGWYAEGPIDNPKDLGPAIKRAIAVVERGEPALIDAVMQPR